MADNERFSRPHDLPLPAVRRRAASGLLAPIGRATPPQGEGFRFESGAVHWLAIAEG